MYRSSTWRNLRKDKGTKGVSVGEPPDEGGRGRASPPQFGEVGSLWLVTISLLFCIAVFVWASPRGYDITDDAFYLITISHPFLYPYAVSEFGYLYHPLYLLAGGDVAALRNLGLAVLCGTGLAFGWTVARFISAREAPRIRYLIAATVVTCTFWQFYQTLRTPNYNELNLCALLLFFSALFYGTPVSYPSTARSNMPSVAIISGTVAGIALALMIIVKPTSGVLTAALGFVWIWLLRPPASWAAPASAAITALVVLFVAVLVIDGSLSAFVGNRLFALTLLRTRGTDGGIHGLGSSIIGPFTAGRRWKILPTLSLSVLFFILNALAFEILWGQQTTNKMWRRATFAILSISVGVLTAWWRMVPVKYPDNSPAYHAWYFVLPLILAAAAFTIGRRKIALNDPRVRRIAAAAVLLAMAPLAYSFGTDNVIVLHMSGAAVFWAASALLVVSLAEASRRGAMFGACAILCSAVTVGMFVGSMAAPVRILQPLWKQTEPVFIGTRGAHVLVDPQTAAYIRGLQNAAVAHQMKPGTRVIDLSRLGPGIVFALSGMAPATPWLHIDGRHPMAFTREILGTVSQRQLQCAWVITGPSVDFRKDQLTLHSLGMNFPEDYEKIASASLIEMNWEQTLWKPHYRSALCD